MSVGVGAEARNAEEQGLLDTLGKAPASTTWARVLADGRFYEPCPLDEDEWFREAPGYCFDNAAELAAEYGLRYVEGFATFQGAAGLPVHHAWNLDAEGRVVDVTWAETGLCYRGIEFDLETVQAARAAEMSALTWRLQ